MTEINYQDLVLKDLNYNSYLKVPNLLSLQQQISKPTHPDEMFFIIIHQTAELWFKEIIHETESLKKAFRKSIISRAIKTLKRIRAIMDLQVQQIRLLSTLTPVEFAGFRNFLKPASGFQSIQYRMIEFIYGVREAFFLKFFEKTPDAANQLKAIREKPSIYDECVACLYKNGYAVPQSLLERDVTQPWQTNQELVKVICDIYELPREHYHWVLLFEGMLDLDETFVLWRKTHAVMVERTIGRKTGTGGSAGYNFLVSRENIHAFPELWEVRNLIGEGY